MVTVKSILDRASLKYEPYKQAGGLPIYMIGGLQLIGDYKAFEAFKNANKHYRGWQAHHVFESQDIDRMHVELLAPSRERSAMCAVAGTGAYRGESTVS